MYDVHVYFSNILKYRRYLTLKTTHLRKIKILSETYSLIHLPAGDFVECAHMFKERNCVYSSGASTR